MSDVDSIQHEGFAILIMEYRGGFVANISSPLDELQARLESHQGYRGAHAMARMQTRAAAIWEAKRYLKEVLGEP